MNHLIAWLVTTIAFAGLLYPIIRYLAGKYYYYDPHPIRFWLNKRQKVKKRYKTFRKRNRKHLVVNKINNYSFNRYSNSNLTSRRK